MGKLDGVLRCVYLFVYLLFVCVFAFYLLLQSCLLGHASIMWFSAVGMGGKGWGWLFLCSCLAVLVG